MYIYICVTYQKHSPRERNNGAQTVIARLIIILLVGTLPGTINCSYCVAE